MINNIIIRNIQSHKLTKLEFHKGVNIIVGTSDSGKTAIKRATELAVTNKPSGSAYVSNWLEKGKTSSVEVTTMEGHTVTRQEKPSKEYRLDDLDPFLAFGAGEPPQEIKDVFNLSEVNIQGQMDKPFLLSSSSGEVATYFNKIARLDKIDTATANVNSWIRELTDDIKYKTNERKKLNDKVDSFKYLTKLEIEVEVLEDMEKKLTGLNSKYSKLNELIIYIKNIELNIEEVSTIIEIEPLLLQILGYVEQKQEIEQKRAKLRKFITTIDETEESIVEQTKLIKVEPKLIQILTYVETKKEITANGIKLKSLLTSIKEDQTKIENSNTLLSVEKPVGVLLELISNVKIKTTAIDSLNRALTALSSTNVALTKKQALFTVLHKEFDLAMPSQCPLCGK